MISIGRFVITPAAWAAMEEADVDPQSLLDRHRRGDWGQMDDADWAKNQAAIKDGGRIHSVYRVHDEVFWIISEADRSMTTLMVPEDY